MNKPKMDLNYLLIPIVLLGSLSLYNATASTSEHDSATSKQRRFFNRLGNNWAVDTSSQYNTPSDDYEVRIKPAALRFLEQLFKSQQRPPIANTEYEEESRYETDREVELTNPYNVEKVYDDSPGRLTRSRTRNKSTFQSLCPSKRETIFLNLDPSYEYRPDYYEEVRCANTVVYSENKVRAAVCSEVGFFCIQLNGTLFLTRRARGDNCWESETRTVATGCECMWPKHQLGDIMAHN